MSSLYFPIAATCVAILINVIYFNKENVNNTETKIYTYLIILNVIHSIFNCVVIYLMKKTNIIIPIFNKIDLVIIMLWLSGLFVYTFAITFNTKKDKKILTFLAFVSMIALFLPINVINEGEILNTSGLAPNYTYLVAVILVIGSLTLLLYSFIMKHRKFNAKKYAPIYTLFAFIFIALILRNSLPNLMIEPFVITYVDLIMFFTIENPDLNHIKELNLAKDQAEKANRAKTEFLSSMSHEIRTPLNAIVGFSECMMDSPDLTSETKEYAKDIVDASNNLLEIVNGILDISKIEANKMEINAKEYNPREVFNSLSKLVIPRINEKPIEFKTIYSKDLPGILKGDVSKVKQIILNILTNAAKYTEKGEIIFNVNCVNRLDTNKCLLYISVKDTGRGIKKEDMDKLFKKFERLDEDINTSTEGTGLGLAITKSLTEMMGGRIAVVSNYGEGSTFRIYLEQDIISMEIPQGNQEEIEIDYSLHKGKRILVVDDSKINLKVANNILKPYNFQVVNAESGFEALEMAETGTYDLILMDIMMPKMNGVETLRRLKEIPGFDIPVVALTADAIEGQDEKYIEAGFNDYLSKPIDRYELNRVLNKFLGGK